MAVTAPATSVNLNNTQIHPAAKPAFDFFFALKRRAPTVREQFDGVMKVFMTPTEPKPVSVIHGINAYQYAQHSSGYALFHLADANQLSDEQIAVNAWRDVFMNLRWTDMNHYTVDSLLALIDAACSKSIQSEAFTGGINPALIKLMTGQLGSSAKHESR
jgi:hypothetical protein